MTDFFYTGANTPATLITALKDAASLANATHGWAGSTGGNIEKINPTNSYKRIELQTSATGYLQLRAITATAQTSSSIYLAHYNQSTSGLVNWWMSISDSHLLIGVEGPAAGQTGALHATYGSYRDFGGIVSFSAWNASDNPTLPWARTVLLGGLGVTTHNTNEYQVQIAGPHGPGSAWALGSLMAPQVVNANIAAVPSGPSMGQTYSGDLMLYPFDVVDPRVGPRGRLLDIRLAQNAPVSGTEYSYIGRSLVDDAGRKWKVLGAARGAADHATSVGLTRSYSSVTHGNGWPLIAVPETT
jgi:hypothetical protein